ncbi:hydrogenase maturation protease [Inmirania thermothiophila]|uniref:Hydrogenase maturation protease n=1 Tax=Inmirania thermothiophila TaxID=1750597 RepID=A0A3N1Y1P6_9GAMM|nr:hydrogenase maturation protease [Inmirania thermothiophila]ROR32754.1 hydrogenase maturation protease [Inmirania thermothiophila]
MSGWRVLAVGSPFGADAVGLEAGRLLAAGPLPAGVEVRCLDRPGAALVAHLEGAEAVLVLDAVAGRPPGAVVRLGRGELLRRSRPASTHALGVAEALALAEALGLLPPRLWLLGMGIGDGGAALPEAAARRLAEAARVLLGAAPPP